MYDREWVRRMSVGVKGFQGIRFTSLKGITSVYMIGAL